MKTRHARGLFLTKTKNESQYGKPFDYLHMT